MPNKNKTFAVIIKCFVLFLYISIIQSLDQKNWQPVIQKQSTTSAYNWINKSLNEVSICTMICTVPLVPLLIILSDSPKSDLADKHKALLILDTLYKSKSKVFLLFSGSPGKDWKGRISKTFQECRDSATKRIWSGPGGLVTDTVGSNTVHKKASQKKRLAYLKVF